MQEKSVLEGKFPTAGIPMGAVVTASGTGAEMNAGAVITYELVPACSLDKSIKSAILKTVNKLTVQ